MTTDITITNQPVVALVTQASGRVVRVQTRPRIVVQAKTVGMQGPPGAGNGGGITSANIGPGFKLVGSEIRYDIASLPRG
jgi:hypothetical protein